MYEAVGRGDTPEESLEHLLELSKQRGAPDNVTAVLLYQE
jgi:serine/threonine protein phosphatase PrpC